MSYPMNEFETDLEKPYEPSSEWIACSSGADESVLNETNDGISAVMEQGRYSHNTVGRRVGNDETAANTLLHKNPYPHVLVGIGAGTLLGFLLAGRLNARSC
jgi:ElaB/YqjD/DUF883 family membrane-anchored ribosome-binding protein